VPASIYDFKAIGGALRKQRIDDWWQPAKPDPEPKVAEPAYRIGCLIRSTGRCHERPS